MSGRCTYQVAIILGVISHHMPKVGGHVRVRNSINSNDLLVCIRKYFGCICLSWNQNGSIISGTTDLAHWGIDCTSQDWAEKRCYTKGYLPVVWILWSKVPKMICLKLKAPALAILDAINLSSSSFGIGLPSCQVQITGNNYAQPL